MEEVIGLVIAGMVTKAKLDENGVFEKVEAANEAGDEDEALHIVRSTEAMTIEALNEIMKDDDELTSEEQAAKAQMYLRVINHNYTFFNQEEPYEEDVSETEMLRQLDEIKMRNGIAGVEQQVSKLAADETEDVFLYDSHDKK